MILGTVLIFDHPKFIQHVIGNEVRNAIKQSVMYKKFEMKEEEEEEEESLTNEGGT